jgi:glycosyltransferase involved in cell wall biosynthesis
MRIAIFSDNFYPELSGVTDSISELARALGRNGHKIIFFAPKYSLSDYNKANVNFEEINLGKNIKIIRWTSLPYPGSPTGQARLVIPSFWRWLKISNYKPDIIHINLPFGTGLEGLLAAKLLKIPLVGTNHTPITEFLPYAPLKSVWLKKISLKYVSWLYNRCDYTVSSCQAIFDEMAEHGFYKPYEVLSNPIGLENLHPPVADKKNKLKQELGLRNNVILYTGRLAPEKNIDKILLAFNVVKNKLPDITLAITGYGSAEYSLKILAKKLKIDTDTRFFGRVPNKTLIKLNQAADIFAVMSTAETQCISMMRAFACGVPAIAANARALPEYLTDEIGFLVEPGNYEALAEKIFYLLSNSRLRMAMGEKAATYAQQFSSEKIAKQWEKIYIKTIKLNKNL